MFPSSALFLFIGMAVSFWCNIVLLTTGVLEPNFSSIVKLCLGGSQYEPQPCATYFQGRAVP